MIQPREFNLSTFKPKHLELIELAMRADIKNIMAAGGIRSGKSITLMTIVLIRAMQAPKTRHGIFHKTMTTCISNIWNLTLPETFEIVLPGYYSELRAAKDDRGGPKHVRISDHEIILPNEARVQLFGLDDPEKLRGKKFSTVWVNEANQINYDTISDLQGRLSESMPALDGAPLETKMLIDLNPTVKSSWEYQLFVEGLVPGDRTPLPNPAKYAWRHINPRDNIDNLPPDYMKDQFGGMSQAKRRREEHGEWGEDNPSALFKADQIGRRTIDPEDCTSIVIAVDPAGSSHKKSDKTGIVVAGKDAAGNYYIFEDCTMSDKPHVWAQRCVDLYRKYNANWIVAEKNCGGDMVETVLERSTIGGLNVPIKLVHASRGKRVRAEPVQVIYEKGLVNHCSVFFDLEREMVEFDAPTFRGSPDRVDALVWGLTELSGEQRAPGKITMKRQAGFFV